MERVSATLLSKQSENALRQSTAEPFSGYEGDGFPLSDFNMLNTFLLSAILKKKIDAKWITYDINTKNGVSCQNIGKPAANITSRFISLGC